MICRTGFWDHGWKSFFFLKNVAGVGVGGGGNNDWHLISTKRHRGFLKCVNTFLLRSSGSLIFVTFEKVKDLKYYRSPHSVLV